MRKRGRRSVEAAPNQHHFRCRGLRNDSVAEMLSLRHTVDKRPFPCNFIKIVPLQSWGPNFYFSVWFVELYGVSDHTAVEPCLNWYDTHIYSHLRIGNMHIDNLPLFVMQSTIHCGSGTIHTERRRRCGCASSICDITTLWTSLRNCRNEVEWSWKVLFCQICINDWWSMEITNLLKNYVKVPQEVCSVKCLFDIPFL